jgi:RNA polymerase sigma-B factor
MTHRLNPYSPANLDALHLDYSKSRCKRLRNRLIEAHLNLVRQQAQRMALRCNLAFDDLFQIGCLGLVAAVEGFDPTKGHAFSTYAVPLIIGKMRHHLRDRHQPIRCSWRLRQLMANQEQLQQQRQHQGLLPLTDAALALSLGCSEQRLLEARQLHRALQCTSLDAQNQNPDSTNGPAIELVDNRPGPEQHLLMQELDEKISALGPVDQRLVRGCWLEGLSQRELARELQLTPCRLSRRLKRLQLQLQQQLSASRPWQGQLQ